MNDELKKEFDGRGRGLTKVQSLHLPQGIGEKYDGLPSGYSLFRQRLEPSSVQKSVQHYRYIILLHVEKHDLQWLHVKTKFR
jgi:hypothetical protein